MKYLNKKIIALAIVAGASSNASAVCCASVGPIVAAIGASATAITGAIAASTTLILNEIAGSSMAASKTIVSGVGASVTQSAEMITENDNKVTAQVHAVDQMRRRRIQDPCIMVAASKVPAVAGAAVSLGGSYGRGGNGSGLYSSGTGAGSGSGLATSGSGRQNILAIAAGAAGAPPTEVLASNAARWACSEFAAGNPLRAKVCDAADLRPGNAASRPDADIRSETLYDGPQETWGTTKMRRTISSDANGSDRVAVEAYLRNLSSPLELRQLEKAELKSEDGRRYMALKDTYEARMSLATRAFRDMSGHKTENVATIPALNAMLKSDTAREYVNGRLALIPGWASRGVSQQELRDIEAGRRHMNLKWREFLAKASEQEVAAEQLQISAYQVVLQTELLEEMLRLRAEFGNIAASGVRQELLPQLQRQHAAATR